MKRFSIIVPVYNVERYLKKCVETILKQTYKNYEIILVNDGSTDQSGEICDEFSMNYQCINVIHKKNGGLSSARNVGLREANGEYIIFIDSDDYIESGTLEEFDTELRKSINADVLITRIKKIYDITKIKYMDKNMPLESFIHWEKEEITKWMFSNSDSLWPSVRYIVKNSFIKRNNLQFPQGYLHEDIEWTFKLFIYAQTFAVTSCYWYNHRMERQGSITTTINSKRTLDVISLVTRNVREIEKNTIQDELKDVMCKRIVKNLFTNLVNYKYYNKFDKDRILQELYRNRDVFQYTDKFKHRVFIYISNIFGFKVGLSIMSLF